jgi:hypothetical protein
MFPGDVNSPFDERDSCHCSADLIDLFEFWFS